MWAESNTNEVERDREREKNMNEAVMADRGRGIEWYEGLTIFAFVALCVPALSEFQYERYEIRYHIVGYHLNGIFQHYE